MSDNTERHRGYYWSRYVGDGPEWRPTWMPARYTGNGFWEILGTSAPKKDKDFDVIGPQIYFPDGER